KGAGRRTPAKGKLHAPQPLLDPGAPDPPDHFEERIHIGPTSTGAMHSGTGQEMALKARLTRLRDSVQREATRLEFLRQERAREEIRNKADTPTGEAVLREHERQLETKVRREEEKLATIERKIELAEVEEEKRRDRIAEAERKISELKGDITEHERTRGDALRAAEAARRELDAVEDAAERLKSKADAEHPDGSPHHASAAEPRPKLKPMTSAATPPGPV
ncbi:MAG: hypothetical protein ACOYMN_04935, partial [Roseimicrobium sp.]